MIAPQITLVAAFLLTASVDLLAQQEPPVAPGDRVRVTAPSVYTEELVGTLSEIGADTCVLVRDGYSGPLYLPFAGITKLEVSRGKKSKAGEGALFGGLFGATLALIGSGAWGSGWGGGGESDFGSDAGSVVLGAVVVGVAVGAIIGEASKSDRWEEVPLGQLRVGLVRQRNDRRGLAVSASIRL